MARVPGFKILPFGHPSSSQKKPNKESDGLFEKILEGMHYAVIACDARWRILFLNTAAERYYGKRTALVGKIYWDAFPHTAGTLLQKEFRRAMAEQTEVKFPYFCECLKKWFEIEAASIGDHFVWFAREVAGHIHAERNLRQERERLNWILEKTGIGLWMNKLPLNLLHWDLKTRELFFIPPDAEATIDLFYERLHPEDREPTRMAVETALLNRELYQIDHRAVHPQTGEIRWVRSIGQATEGVGGAPNRFDGINYDITCRKDAEQALKESEQKFRTIFHTNPCPMTVTTIGEERILDLNRAFEKVTGYSREEALGKTFSELKLWPGKGKRERLKHLLQGQGFFREEEIHIKTRSGKIHTLLLSAEMLEIGGQKCLISSAQDITALRTSQEEMVIAKETAEAANCAKSEFLANMSHEIRTPMTVFMAAIDHLQQIDRNPERRQLLDMAEQSAQRLVALIDDILDLSRIEARRLEIDEIAFAPQSCVEKIVEMLRIKAQEKDLQLGMEVSPLVPLQVLGDPDRIGQVLTNLIGNAIKFTEAGEVRVSIGVRKKMLEFTVSDTGIGIPEEKKGLLFQNFSQLDSSLKRRYGGTGLGLAICKGLVELMGGKIDVRNREGGGSIFSFVLPLKAVKKCPSPVEMRPGETDSDAEFRPIRILLADDEPMVRDILVLALGRCGWRAEIAENGREAVNKWINKEFDLILMDLQMPELTGLEATRKIRELEAGREKRTCIVGITAHARREVKGECLAAGMDMVLTKPVKLKELDAVVESCLPEVRRTA